MRFLFLVLLLAGCSDTERASFSAWGAPGHITCYSGGQVFYEGDSTGKIQTVDKSDGWEFKEKGTDKFVRVSGACVIKN